MKLYNSLNKEKEIFVPIEEKKVKFYSCGQTIYSDMHIGNARTYSYWAVLVSYLRWKGYDVFWVQNITDVGHLTDDSDEGEDKVEKEAQEKNVEPMVLVETQIRRFFEDMDTLNILRADIYPRASGHITEIIDFVSELIQQGYAYETNGSVYFDTNAFPAYGKLNPVTYNDESVGKRISLNKEKRHPKDFALWIKAPPEHIMKWSSPWGKGYPGWHIECSTMVEKYLGKTIDIHSGGIEHLMMHHPNEVAQSEAKNGLDLAKYWLHAQHLTINGEKMGKSLGNKVTIRELVKIYDPIVIRFFLVFSHYRKNTDFSSDTIESAQLMVQRIYDTLKEIKQFKGNSDESLLEDLKTLEDEFKTSMDDDLNTVGAIHSIMRFLKKVNAKKETKKEILAIAHSKIVELLGILGINIENFGKSNTSNKDLAVLMELIIALREAKRYDLTDLARNILSDIGIKLEDKKIGTVWKKEKLEEKYT